MAAKPRTYAQAVEQAHAAIGAARLADPDDHFPYKLDDALAAARSTVPMGPGQPDGLDGTDDTSRTAADYLTEEIARASADYVAAQEAVLRDPSDDNQAAYTAARDRLQAARLDHRANRGGGYTIGAAARRAG